jgi:4'-phosphopantetheinyl transferase
MVMKRPRFPASLRTQGSFSKRSLVRERDSPPARAGGRPARMKRGAVHPASVAECEQIGDEMHVWHAALDRESDTLARLELVLSPEEKARADRFHFVNDRNRFVVARGLLRELLGRYLHQFPADLEFSYAEHGKPALSGGNASTGLCFNLSHSAGLVVYAIARERNLGIDVEHVRPEFASDGIAERYFSASEVSDLRRLPSEARVAGFFNCWTRKEAYLKATGMGLQIPLNSFAVSVWSDRPAQFLRGVEPRWHLDSFDPAEGYVAAVVYNGAPCSIKYRSVDSHSK